MSYAIETKKRKFERILETLTDSVSIPSKGPLNPITNVSTSSISHASTSDSSKRRRITPNSTITRGQPSITSLTTQYLPSSRAAFLQRLETFRNVTRWRIPSTSAINAAKWAKRGWICEGSDTVSCPSCRESVFVDLEVGESAVPNNETEDSKEDQELDDEMANMEDLVYEGLVKRYCDMIVNAHDDGCPWRRRGCDSSIQRIEGLLNSSNALTVLRSRYEELDKITNDTPHVANLPSLGTHNIDQQELRAFEMSEHEELNIDTLKLAICGWQGKETDVLECRHCFRSLGLWLYRGDNPTMDQLDAVDSHLEYCPWRSSDAQDAEVIITKMGETGKEHVKEKQPGWLLTYEAIVKDNAKRATPKSRRVMPSTNVSDDTVNPTEFTPEQREKKMKDMRQRIRDLKKPFNFKALLRRKDKSTV